MSRLIEGLESIKVLFDTKAKQSENAGYWKDFAGIIADAISTITEKTQRIENMETMIEDMEERIAIMTEHGLWIPVTDRLPQDDEDVLVWVNGTHRDMAYRDEGVWYDEEHNHLKNITHWMPLPEPPKEGEA